MKTIIHFSKKTINAWLQVSITLLTGILFLISPSCQKDEGNFLDKESLNLKRLDMKRTYELSCKSSILYYGHKTFTRVAGAPFVETQKLENPNFDYFDGNFILKIQNGRDKKTRVSSAEIRIDGVLIVGPSCFSKNVSFITKKLRGLTSESILEVKLNSAPGCFIDLWIEGTLKEGVVADNDGNFYKTVKIGDQWWMAENLKTTRYRNGDLIGTTTPATLDISGESEPKYQWAYNGIESNVGTYGRLYTWYAVTDSRGVCPTGWHVSTDAEWTTLTDYLTNNGYGYEGSGADIAKSLAAKSGWSTDATPGNIANDQASNNSSGFTALPSGYRISNGIFEYISIYASWWSSSESGNSAWHRILSSHSNSMGREIFKKRHGDAIRCVRD